MSTHIPSVGSFEALNSNENSIDSIQEPKDRKSSSSDDKSIIEQVTQFS